MSACDVSIVAPRLDAKPWGGTRLSQFGLDLPEGEKIGEALVTANDAVITAGFAAGQTLGDVVASDPDFRLGPLGRAAVSNKPIFPLLVKLIDAAENLSIQVHPNDEMAAPLDNLGKTEAWYVLSTEADGALYIGLDSEITSDKFMQHAHLLDGTSAADLRREEAVSGETWMIPAGTVHALGAGVMVYEIQQPSDVTFRLDDWGRVDAAGNPREMHLEHGEIAIRPELRPNPIPAVRLDTASYRQILTACKYFALEKFDIPEMYQFGLGQTDTPNVITVLSGQLSVGDHELVAGESAVVWPGDEAVGCSALTSTVALRSWVPNIVRDIAEPVRAAGGLDSDIAALGGMTTDIQEALS